MLALELTVSPLGIASTTITPSETQETVIMTLQADRVFLILFWGEIEDSATPWIAF
jgi:uncharacterized membrane protein AbrB (regulator of aidB expression)